MGAQITESCAYHEAGHAVADVRFEFTCDLVSIIRTVRQEP
jgi:hypothetical protein